MLRSIFGEPRRQDEGYLKEANEAIRSFIHKLTLIPPEKRTMAERRFVILSEGFLRALDELEQSEYAAQQYGKRVMKLYLDEMTLEEKDAYHLHLYFYKNALIRLFALLDKLGNFINEHWGLQTERIKARFSYFTVLRNMHQNKKYTDLEQKLFDLKVQYKTPVERLRNRRNLEIHSINADLYDDLMKVAELKYGQRARLQIEDIRENLRDLEQGIDMTFRAAAIVFRYAASHASNRKG
ncbi:Cthe_2314 family HEPN domain-containing protein [Paenibacillus silviterrae]|uniref:Cthe_2314 family HEPN domain-containing protein n=1 Tax=Paenibacillus silviterrae TaxID=3242194 RepID=UPI0025432B6E|nr:Cthe_2314 family HEPN domain-containing protein [Paenibacillus chinjuensis]